MKIGLGTPGVLSVFIHALHDSPTSMFRNIVRDFTELSTRTLTGCVITATPLHDSTAARGLVMLLFSVASVSEVQTSRQSRPDGLDSPQGCDPKVLHDALLRLPRSRNHGYRSVSSPA